jgi:ribosomal protein L28
MFGRSPEFNLAHKSTATKKRLNPNSISQKVITELKQQSLEKFL